MTVTLPNLVQPLKWDGSDFESGIERAITKGSTLGTVFGNIATSAISGAFRLAGEGLQFIGNQAQIAFADLIEVQDVQAQLNAVLESTGGIAGVTAEQVNSLADAFELTTKFSAEQTLAGENLLLTFTNIGADVFPQATETMLDMSQALGQGMKESAVQLGKALQDPILGVTALRRVGVNFTEEQQNMIEKMVEAGEVGQAQAFILKELQTEFGGSAVAAGQTFGGQLEILNNKIGAVRERIFSGLMPVLQESADKFSTWLSSPEFQASLDNFTNWITNEAVPYITGTLLPAIQDFATNAAISFADFKDRTADEVSVIGSEWEELTASGRELFGTLFERDMPNMAEVGETALQLIAITIHGINSAIEKLIGWVDRLKASWAALPDNLPSTGGGGPRPPGFQGYRGPGFASGGAFTVPAGFPGDSFPMRVSSGERVQVTPAGGQSSGEMSDASMRKLSKMLALELAKAVR